MNAPGANTKISEPNCSGIIVRLNSLPVPNSSRTAPNSVKAIVKPRPIPIPSKAEATTPFLAAKASARPNTIQLTTINGMNNPKLAYKAGINASMHICTTVTKVAITTMYPGIRTISGITFFNADMTMLEQINTNMVASPILIPFIAEEVVPSVGHIPNSNTNVGFSVMIPFINIFRLLIVVSSLFSCVIG